MSFPIVQGTLSTSTRSLTLPEPVEEYAASDQTNLVPGASFGPFALFAASPELNAVVTLSYYEMLREDSMSIECWTAEVRVQIIPSCEGFSDRYRDSLYRIELPESSASIMGKEETHQGVTPMAIFSNDQRSLVCLIPHAHDTKQSSVVVFQLRKPKQTKTSSPQPPLPSYMASTELPMTSFIAPVATNPRVLKSSENAPLLDVTAICSAEKHLVVGCRSGRTLLASYRPLQTVGHEDPFRNLPVAALSAWKDDQLAVVYDDGMVSCFRFCEPTASLRRNGSARSMNSSTELADDSDVARRSFAIRSVHSRKSHATPSFLRRTHYSLEDAASKVCWLEESYLALLDPSWNKVRIRSLQENGESTPIQQLTLDPRDLVENAHISETLLPDSSTKATWFRPSHRGLTLDPWTRSCLAINTTIRSQKVRLSCNVLWNWRANTQGFSAVSSGHCLPDMQFAWQPQQGRKLTRLLLRQNGVVTKELMDMALLSPPSSLNAPRIYPATSLLLASRTIAYPLPRRSSALENFEIRWTQNMIPKQYTQLFGAPLIATFASTYGRSIAVASSRGICVLECSGPPGTSTARGFHAGRTNPRWHLFANACDERSFRVVSFTWWEQVLNPGRGRADDLLLAVIEVLEEERYYLCCWPSRELGKRSQLLSLVKNRLERNGWGVPLPESYVPGAIDIVVCPLGNMGRSKACVLLSAPDSTCSFLVFQLQAVAGQEKEWRVACREASIGCVGDKTELFLASASFDYDLRLKDVESGYDLNVATVGSIRPSGIDALLLSSSTISAIGQVLCSKNLQKSDVTNFWLSDVLKWNTDEAEATSACSFVWSFELANGKIRTWYLPFESSVSVATGMTTKNFPHHDNEESIFQPVHPNGPILGVSTWTGSTSHWMHQSTRGARRDFLAGCAPSSQFGFVVGIAQSCRPVSTVTGTAAGPVQNRFVVFEASGLTLYPPSRLAPMFGLAAADSKQSGSNEGCMLEQYLEGSRTDRSLHKSIILCLQVMTLRAVEKALPDSQSGSKTALPGSSSSVAPLRSLLRSLRTMSSPLQFISTLLQLGRQLEASSLERLFPLDLGRQEPTVSIKDSFVGATHQGSLRVALSAIPILDDNATTKSTCTSIFRHCLDVLYNYKDDNQHRILSMDSLPYCIEEWCVMVDVFGYAMKIESPDADENEDANVGKRRYSLGCGMPVGLGRAGSKRRERNSSVLFSPQNASMRKLPGKNFKELKFWDDYDGDLFATVLATLSRFTLSILLGSDYCCQSWRKLGLIAQSLVAADAPFERFSTDEFGALMDGTPTVRFTALAPDTNDFFRLHTSSKFQIEREDAESIFELCLIILGNGHDDVDSDIAGLILIAIVAGHAAGCLDRAIDFGRHYKSSVWASFLLVTSAS